MKKTIFGMVSCLAIGAALAPSASAAPVVMTGSDTLLDMTRSLLTSCGAACSAVTGIQYNGGGSTAGQTDLVAGTATDPYAGQIIAPMSRALNTAACITTPVGANPARQATAKGWVLAYDGLSLLSNATTAELNDTVGTDTFGGDLKETGSVTVLDLATDDGKPLSVVPGAPVANYIQYVTPHVNTGVTCKGCASMNNAPLLGSNPQPVDSAPGPQVYTFGNVSRVTVAGGVVTAVDDNPAGTRSGRAGTAWQDVLRILFTGATRFMDATRIGTLTAAVAPDTTVNGSNQRQIEAFCGGDLRRSVALSWANVTENCTAATCSTPVKRLLRRGDASGTTDTFLAVLNLPSIRNNPSPVQSGIPVSGSPFCNGNDQRDNDPIRVACSVGTAAQSGLQDMSCSRYVLDDKGNTDTRDDIVVNSLGLLLPVFPPEELTTPPAIGGNPALPGALGTFAQGTPEYNNQRKFPRPTCSLGGVMFGRTPNDPDTGLALSNCPDGVPCAFDQSPITSGSTGSSAACISKVGSTNLPGLVNTWFSGSICSGLPDPDGPGPLVAGCNGVKPDPRVYNAIIRNPSPTQPAAPPTGYDGRITQFSRVIVGSPTQSNRDMIGAFYRVRQTLRSPAAAQELCASDSATLDIGCIAGEYTQQFATDFALGFAGREGDQAPNAAAMKISGAAPTPASVRGFLDSGSGYKLSRKLFINTLTNTAGGNPEDFAPTAGTNQADMRNFLAYLDTHEAVVANTATSLGFISVRDTGSASPAVVDGPRSLRCVDFNSSQCPTPDSPSESNACRPDPL